MKSIIAFTAFAITGLAAPVADNYEPKGGWESVEYPKGTGENLHEYPAPPGGWENVDYPDGTGENLHEYPAPPGGWENVDYPDGTGATPQPSKGECTNGPLHFTSTYHVLATPDQVVNGTTPTGGLAGTTGTYDLGINSDLNLICYKIVLTNFRGDYQSPADTATHIHEAAKGASGPPRIAFPNPQGDGHERISVGCLSGPFLTGVVNATTGIDSGEGFHVSQIEENPAGFFADVHSSLAVPGAVRGQLA